MNVFHLKYRPQKIEELDSKEVANSLKKILSNKEIPQSFLFTGPKGAGKTSAARILAKAVNCLDLKNGEPCSECTNCKEILNGSSIDIIEIDAASNRGIEDARALKEKSYLLPSKLNKKVFIIDEVHMLTKEAFNALLKLIEEPPKHTIFILCTTNAEKIPDTILSRLIKIDFKKGKKDELVGALEKIVEGEKIEIDKKSLDLIVQKSDGSFRNVHRTFNEIYLQFGNKISNKDVEKFFETKSGDYSEEKFEEDLVKGEPKIILEKLEGLAETGIDFVDFRERLLSYFQKKILICYGVNEDKENLVSKLKANDLTRLINLLINASKQEKEVSIDQLPLELAVIEFFSAKQNGSAKQSFEETEKAEGSAKQIDIVNQNLCEEIKEEFKEEFKEELETIEEEVEETFNVAGKLQISDVESEWGNVLMTVKPFNHSVEAFLRATRPKTVKGNVLVVEVFYPFHKDRLEESKNRKVVEMSLSKVFKMDLGFECVLGKVKKEPLVIKNDTPIENVSEQLAEEKKDKDIYDVAKEIFG